MEETMERMAESIDDLGRKFYGVATGKVINLIDPMMLGRVQIQLPFISSTDLSPWARVAVPMAGIAHGTYFIPSLGDEVLVAFEQGDLKAPYVIGSLWNAMAPPPLPNPLAQMRTIRTPLGNQILFTDVPPSITILTPSGQTILMNTAGIQILSGTNLINLTPDGITVAGANINLTATAAINITAPNVTVNGAANANFQSAGVCNVTAPLVKIN